MSKAGKTLEKRKTKKRSVMSEAGKVPKKEKMKPNQKVNVSKAGKMPEKKKTKEKEKEEKKPN